MIKDDENYFLKVSDISFSYNGTEKILKDISFTINPGDSLGILGPNGGGKSTLIKIIAGLLPYHAGTIFFENKLITSSNCLDYSKISYVPQNDSLNEIFPVKVEEYLDLRRSLLPSSNKTPSNEELLRLVGLLHKRDSLISKLSGGEKQRVLIARAMINTPKLLLLDEPTKGLDSNGQDQLLSLIKNIQNENNTAIIIIDHNINQVIRNCSKILCLNRTSHWHNSKDLLTKDILENIYHCEFEHLLIHENESRDNNHHDHTFCDHDHSQDKSPHKFIVRKK